ncbi:hypothetical protein ScPMuIL_016112 [Solemya velum]
MQTQKQVLGYPLITISKETTRSLAQRENAKSAFLPRDETVWKRAFHAWYEGGLSGVFEEVVNSEDEVPSWVSSASRGMLTFVRLTSSLHGSLFPHLALSNEDIIAAFSNITDWNKSPVKAFAWHPHTPKFAYTQQDDSIRVHLIGSELVPILKHKLQKNVADLAWQPQCSSVLAVACQTCILIWHVEPTSLATRPSSSSVQVLHHQGHSPITSLSWNPNGDVLLSASPVDTAMMAWDVSMERCVPLRRMGGGGVSLVAFSPDCSKVFAATPSHIFRVWETTHWSCEMWSYSSGRCVAACWSPDGNILLFAIENEPVIYSLIFSTSQFGTGEDIGGSQRAIACVDLSEVTLESADCQTRVGGCVQAMCWDDTGERLAVMFKERRDDSGLVALFRTRILPVLEILPCGFVRGPDSDIPQHIAFQPKFEKGALLSVVWSSGKLSYVPLYYVPGQAIGQHQF